MDKIEDVLVWTLVGIFGFLILFLASYIVKVVFFPSENENKIHTETMCVDNHKYIIFYDVDNEVKHIEHSPECDCYTIEYD